MKNKKAILIVVLGVLMIPLACTRNFLNPANTSAVGQQGLFTTPQDAISLVNAIYDEFQHDNQNFLLKGIWYNANYTTQDYFNWGADVSYNTYEFPTDFASLPIYWNDSYQGIARANSVFPVTASLVSQGILTDSLANFLNGQAYFLRGVFYYYLACTFGGVPLELNVQTTGYHARSSQDSVFMQVEHDMDSASLLLPWPQQLAAADLGRCTKGAALGYKGAAEMWLKDYKDAITDFTALIPHYTLLPNFMSIGEYNNQNNAESIFEIQFDLPSGATPDWTYSNNEVTWFSSFMWPYETSDFGYTYSNKLLYTSFEAGDTRKPATIIGPDDTIASPGIVAIGGIQNYSFVIQGFQGKLDLPASHFTGTNGKIINTCGKTGDLWTGDQPGQPRSGYYPMKYWRDPNVSGNSPSQADGQTHIFGDQNITMLRLGEIYLELAECYYQTGDQTDANTALATVRNRAFGGTAPPDPYGPDFMQEILEEYRHELSGEMSTWYDMRRTGLQLQYIQNTFGITIPTGHDLLPIPQSDIETNPLLKQNPGY
jgi:hypothetical protein